MHVALNKGQGHSHYSIKMEGLVVPTITPGSEESVYKHQININVKAF